MEGVGLDAQVMDDEREGSVISEDDRATSVWDGDDSRSEMMVSVKIWVLAFESCYSQIFSGLDFSYFHESNSEVLVCDIGPCV